MRKNYKTNQKSMIMEIISKNGSEFTINDIYCKLNHKVGLTTIYRMVDELITDGLISKTAGKGNITYYQYIEKCDCENHFYLKCETCGEIEHVDCDCIKDLSKHIIKKHNFKVNKDKIIIAGICSKCQKGGK